LGPIKAKARNFRGRTPRSAPIPGSILTLLTENMGRAYGLHCESLKSGKSCSDRARLTMSFKRALVGWRRRCIIPVLILALIVNLALYAQFAQANAADRQISQPSFVKMSFHMYGQVYSNSNSSIFVYNGADTNAPTYASAPTATVSCAIHQSTQIWFLGVDAWFGGVSWITQPLAEEMTIQGNVSMTVWMSATDSSPTASGYAFGLTEVDSMGNPIGDQSYQYSYGSGSVLSQSPAQYTLVFGVNRTFAKGNILGFFVIVGSTTEGWHYQAYFDSPSKDSFVELPTMSTPIPEFSQLGTVACMALAMLCLGIIHRRKR